MNKQYLTTVQMIADGTIRYKVQGRPPETFFSVDDMKAKYPRAKVASADVYNLEYEGEIIPMCKSADVEEMTAWDEKVMKTMKFDPRK